MLPNSDNIKKDPEDSELRYRLQAQKVPWYDQILLSGPLKITIAFILAAIAIPLIIYKFYFFTTFELPPSDGYSVGTCLVQREHRIPCGIGSSAHQDCHPQCCYDLRTNFCFHRVPSRFSYIMDQIWNEDTILYPRIATVPYKFQNSLPRLKLSIDEISESHLILRLYDARNITHTGNRLNKTKYKYEITSPEMSIMINSTSGTIFNMGRGPLIASDNIWEASFILTNETMYGLGEIPLRENITKVLYNHDGGTNSVPVIYARVNNTYHGLLFESNEPTEISVHGENRIVVRSITNHGFTFHLFAGPNPRDVMNDVMKVIGTNSNMDYWMLGAHICNEIQGEDLNSFISNATNQKLPYESLCGAESITFESDPCDGTNQGVNEGANIIKQNNKRFVPYVSPFIRLSHTEPNSSETYNTCDILPSYEDQMYRDRLTMEVYRGSVDGHQVMYPSYASSEFMNVMWRYHQPDAVVLSNNWPLDQSKKYLNETGLPYFNKNLEQAFKNTPPWDLILKDDDKSYIFKHNDYGNKFANAFEHILADTMIWSSSQLVNGRIAINRQNIDTSWTNLKKELVEAALGGISGHWYWLTPVCGDTNNFNIETHTELCVKWYMASTYFPMIKIHSKSEARHPLAFTGTYKTRVMEALQQRLSMLSYFYTTLQNGPLLRPMFYQFPSSSSLKDVTSQFSVGDDVIIVPNLQPTQAHVHFWMPPGTWYEFWSGLRMNGTEGGAVTMTTTDADFLTLIRGGSILTIQKNTQKSAEDTRLSDFSIIIALECDHNGTCGADGNIFITKHMMLEFKASENDLAITSVGDDFNSICDMKTRIWGHLVKEISVYGLDDDFNNYDHHRNIIADIDICDLKNIDVITFNFI